VNLSIERALDRNREVSKRRRSPAGNGAQAADDLPLYRGLAASNPDE
jgi:hypothetical protein